MSTLQQVRLVSLEPFRLAGPGGEVELRFASDVQEEANESDPKCQPRLAAEWCREVDVEGEPRLRRLVFVATHDSYDGEHRVVVEDSVVCRPLVAALFAELGVSGEPLELVRRLAELQPELAAPLTTLAEGGEANVTDEQSGPELL